jgi:hypothetical protein
MSVIYFHSRGKNVPDYEQKCYPGTSDIQVFKYRDNPPSYEIRASFEGVRNLIEALESPRHANRIYCMRICSGAMFIDKSDKSFRRFKNYTVEQFGLLIEPTLQKRGGVDAGYTSLKESDYLCLPLYWNENPDYRIQVWRTRIFACSTADIQTSPSKPLGPTLPLVMYLEERWHPYRGKRRSLTWLEHLNRNNKVIEQFRRDALLILGNVKRSGRRKLYANPEVFYQEMLRAYNEVGKRAEKDPSQEEVAEEMKPELSVRTFRQRLNQHEISWPPKG